MIAVLFGTRPEFIKLAPVLNQLRVNNMSFVLIHSGQHYSKELDEQIIRDLDLPSPDYNLKVGSGSPAEQTAKILIGVEKILKEKNPELLLVHGDTNTMLAGSLAAKKIHIPIAHIEAGLRSFDINMPEEINRIITDRISDLLFTPTEGTKRNLLNEGVSKDKIFITGNTIVDSVATYLPLTEKSVVLKANNLEKNNYILVTAHRSENVDNLNRLKKLVFILNFAYSYLNKKIIWPMHPHTKNQLLKYNIKISEGVKVIPSVSYLDMLMLINFSYFVLTDSGGIQEEAYILKKKLITLRGSTERPETLTANFLVDLDKDKFKDAVIWFENSKVYWNKNAFSIDGKSASELIVKHIQKFLKNK